MSCVGVILDLKAKRRSYIRHDFRSPGIDGLIFSTLMQSIHGESCQSERYATVCIPATKPTRI